MYTIKEKWGEKKCDDNKSEKTSKKASHPFYVSKANFLSLLNIAEMIEQSGSLRYCWEDDNESYIQNVKREISTMKHNEHYAQPHRAPSKCKNPICRGSMFCCPVIR